MSNEDMTTIARPYAMAAFEYALAKQEIPEWETMLKSAASLTEDKNVARLLTSPNVSAEKLANLFCEVLKPVTNVQRNNFIRLLAENKRLRVLPNIVETFEALRAQYENTLEVQVTSAIDLDAGYKKTLADALTKRLHRTVSLHCTVDPNLLGGAVVRAGDLVFDGSVRGKLNRMIEFI